MRFLENIAISFVISIAVAAAALFVYDRHISREIVVFDIPAYVDNARREFLKGDISEEVLKQRFAMLETHLKDMSKNKIILNKQAVIAGGRELSDEVQ